MRRGNLERLYPRHCEAHRDEAISSVAVRPWDNKLIHCHSWLNEVKPRISERQFGKK